jgi:predicted DNA-binding WGR domain protein
MTYHGTVEQVSYQDPGVNSDKFYRAYLIEDDESTDVRVLFQWGRRGSKGQNQVAVFGNEIEAQAAIDRKLYEKRHKGYSERAGDGKQKIDSFARDLLESAGINAGAKPISVTREQAVANVFLDFSGEVDRVRRLAYGTQEEQAQAFQVRNGLREQLETLRTSVLKADGQLEFVEDVLHMAMEGAR